MPTIEHPGAVGLAFLMDVALVCFIAWIYLNHNEPRH